MHANSNNSPMASGMARQGSMNPETLADKRREAAAWVAALTGAALDATTDLAFRAGLMDGVALCRLANALWPGIIPKVCVCVWGVCAREGGRLSSRACSNPAPPPPESRARTHKDKHKHENTHPPTPRRPPTPKNTNTRC